MGLDKGYLNMLLFNQRNKNMLEKIRNLVGYKSRKPRKVRLIRNDFFRKYARDQFEKLSEKGLSIPVATL